jgi:5'-AMP-activated protein kinase, regulatory gamma subunit
VLTIGDVRNKKKDWEEKLQKCRSSITLYEALEVIVRTESHRLLLVNKEDKLIGIVSLSDILVYLNRVIPTEKKVSSLQEIFRPLEENKVPESPREAENEIISIEVPNLNSCKRLSLPEADEIVTEANCDENDAKQTNIKEQEDETNTAGDTNVNDNDDVITSNDPALTTKGDDDLNVDDDMNK